MAQSKYAKDLKESLLKDGVGEKEATGVAEIVDRYVKECEAKCAAECADYKKKVDAVNDALIKKEAAKLAEGKANLTKEKYLTDLENAKAEIRKQCEEEAEERATLKIKTIKEEFDRDMAVMLMEKEKEFKAQALKEAQEKINEALAITEDAFNQQLSETLSVYKSELSQSATEQLELLESNIVTSLNPLITQFLEEHVSASEIKNFVSSKVSNDALAAIIEALETKFVGPDTQGHKLLQEKEEQIVKLQESLALEQKKSEELRKNADLLAKKQIIAENCAGMPEILKTKAEQITEGADFEAALTAVKAMSEAYDISLAESGKIDESVKGPIGSPASNGLSLDEKKDLERSRQIEEMFLEPGLGITQEDDRPAPEEGYAQINESDVIGDIKQFGNVLKRSLR